MNMYMPQPEPDRTLAADETQSDLHPGHGVITMPMHDDIAQRAYSIYVNSGRTKGQCKKNWHQAEYELRTEPPRLPVPGDAGISERQA
jgi:hypothetical protein